MLLKNVVISAFLSFFSLSAQSGNWFTQDLASKANLQFNNGDSGEMATSENGRFIVFSSCASTLVENDNNEKCDIFLADTSNNKTILVTSSVIGSPETIILADGDSHWPTISTDASTIYIAFESTATNLISNGNDTNDIYFTSLQYDNTSITSNNSFELISTAIDSMDETIVANGSSFKPSISGNGNRIVFESVANNLSAKGGADQSSNDTNGVRDIFIRDRLANTTSRINKTTNTLEIEDASYSPIISNDGLYVVFESTSSYLSSEDTDNNNDVFRYSIANNEVALISLKSSGSKVLAHSGSATISADGNIIVFQSYGDLTNDNTDTDSSSDIYLRNISESTTTLVSLGYLDNNLLGGANLPSVSNDGTKVVYIGANAAGDPLVTDDNNVYYYDLSTNEASIISVVDNGVDLISGNIYLAKVSADGNSVTYNSDRIFVDGEGDDDFSDIYTYHFNGDAPSSNSQKVNSPIESQQFIESVDGLAMSSDGRYSLLQSSAKNILPGGGEYDSLYILDRGVNGDQTQLERLNFGMNGTPLNGSIGLGEFDISDDGNIIVFSSFASNITLNDNNAASDIFYHNRVDNTTNIISFGYGGGMSQGSSSTPSISSDGNKVAYASKAINIIDYGNSNSEIYLYDAITNTNILVSHTLNGVPENVSSYDDSFNPRISADGNFVSYVSNNESIYGFIRGYGHQIVVYNVNTDGNTLVTYDTDGYPSEFNSFKPSISGDGRFIAYSTHATDNILGTDTDGSRDGDIILYDRLSQNNRLISYDNLTKGEQGNQIINAFDAVISDDASHVVFKTAVEDENIPDTFHYGISVRDILNEYTSIVATSNALPDDEFDTATSNTLFYFVTTLQPYISADGGIILYPSNIPQAFQNIEQDGTVTTTAAPVIAGSDITQAYFSIKQEDFDNDGIPDIFDEDDDNDGMSNQFEIDNGLDPLNAGDANLDSDNDGLTNIEEFNVGTDPNSDDTDMDNLPDSYEVANGLNANGDDSQADPDEDSLTNLQEYGLGTDPKIFDTDDDDIPDGYEVLYDLDPLDAIDASLDQDLDDLTNLEEFQIGTNPNIADTDNDGVLDGQDALPLNEASERRLDVDMNGVDDIPLLVDLSNGKQAVMFHDSATGNQTTAITLPSWFIAEQMKPIFFATTVPNSITPTVLQHIVTLGATTDGKKAWLVFDINSKTLVSSFAFPVWFQPKQLLVVEDVNGNYKDEILVFGQTSDGKSVWMMHDSAWRAEITRLVYEQGYEPDKLTIIGDTDNNGESEVVSFGITSNNCPSTSVICATWQQHDISSLIKLGESKKAQGYTINDLVGITDNDGNGMVDLLWLGTTPGGKKFFKIENATTAKLVLNYSYADNFIADSIVGKLNYSQFTDKVISLSAVNNMWQSNDIFLDNQPPESYVLSDGYQSQALITIADVNGDDIEDILLSGKNSDNKLELKLLSNDNESIQVIVLPKWVTKIY